MIIDQFIFIDLSFDLFLSLCTSRRSNRFVQYGWKNMSNYYLLFLFLDLDTNHLEASIPIRQAKVYISFIECPIILNVQVLYYYIYKLTRILDVHIARQELEFPWNPMREQKGRFFLWQVRKIAKKVFFFEWPGLKEHIFCQILQQTCQKTYDFATRKHNSTGS